MSYPSLPISFHYKQPIKRIFSEHKDLYIFQKTEAYTQIQTTIQLITQLVEFTPLPSENNCSEIINSNPWLKAIVTILKSYSLLIDETPPFKPCDGTRTRFGNPSRRLWQDKIESITEDLIKKELLPRYIYSNSHGFIQEVSWYLLNSFGSKERLDYGTGHELNFLAFIISLWRVNIVPNPSINEQEVINGTDLLIVFSTYYETVMKLILTYNLEPAGSHGVWGLDDHFHLLYIIGSSQLINPETKISDTTTKLATATSNRRQILIEDEISPRLLLNKSQSSALSESYLFFRGIQFINTVKPHSRFMEHSPILYDISQMKNWSKIQRGLIKMFQGEVIEKFPVVQHFWFGGVLMPWIDQPGKPPRNSEDDENNKHFVNSLREEGSSTTRPIERLTSSNITPNRFISPSFSRTPLHNGDNLRYSGFKIPTQRPTGTSNGIPMTNDPRGNTTKAPWSK